MREEGEEMIEYSAKILGNGQKKIIWMITSRLFKIYFSFIQVHLLRLRLLIGHLFLRTEFSNLAGILQLVFLLILISLQPDQHRRTEALDPHLQELQLKCISYQNPPSNRFFRTLSCIYCSISWLTIQLACYILHETLYAQHFEWFNESNLVIVITITN